MKKLLSKALIFVLITVLVLSMAGCGGKDEGAQDGGDQVYTIKWAHGASPDSAEGVAIDQIIEEVKEASNGRLNLVHYPQGQLGDENEIYEGCQLGTIEMCTISGGSLSGFYPEILALNTPFAFNGREEAWQLLDGSVGQYFAEGIEASTGVKCLGWSENGQRCFSSNGKQIKVPADLKGMRVRTQQNAVTMKMVEACGGNVSVIAFGELYTALSQGAVDAQENPVTLFYTQGMYEVQEYLTLDYHIYDVLGVFVNPEYFAALPEDLQKILTEYALKYVDVERDLSAQYEVEQAKACEESGVVVYEINDDEYAQWETAMKPVVEEVRNVAGSEATDMVLNGIQAIRDGSYK